MSLGNDTGWASYDSFINVGTITRAMNGEPFPYFYGLKTDGIFQTQEEIDSYTGPDGTPIQPNAKPGYVRFKDLNNDGKIDDNDRTKIGKGMPDWTFGFNFTAAWRGLDFAMMWQGTAGNDVFDATRRIDINSINLPSYMLGRWTGPGTSDKYPIFIVGDASDNWKSSDLYVHDASYLRLKNIEPWLHPAAEAHPKGVHQQAAPVRVCREPSHAYKVPRLRPGDFLGRNVARRGLRSVSPSTRVARGLQPGVLTRACARE